MIKFVTKVMILEFFFINYYQRSCLSSYNDRGVALSVDEDEQIPRTFQYKLSIFFYFLFFCLSSPLACPSWGDG